MGHLARMQTLPFTFYPKGPWRIKRYYKFYFNYLFRLAHKRVFKDDSDEQGLTMMYNANFLLITDIFVAVKLQGIKPWLTRLEILVPFKTLLFACFCQFQLVNSLSAVYILKLICILDCKLYLYVELLSWLEVIPCLIKRAIYYPMDLVNFWTRGPPDAPKYMHIKNLQN